MPDFLAIDIEVWRNEVFDMVEAECRRRGLKFVARKSDGRIDIERPCAADGWQIVVEFRGVKTR